MSEPFVVGERYCETASRGFLNTTPCVGIPSNDRQYLPPPSSPDDHKFREGAIIDLSRTLELGLERRKAWALRVSVAHEEQTGRRLFITDDDIRNGRGYQEGAVSHEREVALDEVYKGLCYSCQETASQNPAIRRAAFKRWAIHQLDTTDWKTFAITPPEGIVRTNISPKLPDPSTDLSESRSSVLPGAQQVLNMPQGHPGAPMDPLRSFNSVMQKPLPRTEIHLPVMPRPNQGEHDD